MIANSNVRPSSPVVKRCRTVSNGATSEVTIGAAAAAESTREDWPGAILKKITTHAAIATNAAPISTTSGPSDFVARNSRTLVVTEL
jgi:hypothetical protein